MTKREFNDQLDQLMVEDFAILNGLSTYGELYERWNEFIEFCKEFRPQAKKHFREHGDLIDLVYG